MLLSDIQPTPNEPVLFIKNKKILVFADLHIGIESELRAKGLSTPPQTPDMTNRLLELFEKYKPKEIIILGDVKHNIPSSTYSERRDINKFLETIKNYGKVHVIPGNHDGNIKNFSPAEIVIHPSEGLLLENIGFVHGHRWPSEEIMQADQIIMAHTHPTVMLIDRLEHKSFESCWVKTSFDKSKIAEKYPNSSNPQVLIVPAFNPLCGGIPINKEGVMGPLGKLMDIDKSEIYLLDGTLLGNVKNIR